MAFTQLQVIDGSGITQFLQVAAGGVNSGSVSGNPFLPAGASQVSGTVQVSGLVGIQSGLLGIQSGLIGVLSGNVGAQVSGAVQVSGQIQLLPNSSGGFSVFTLSGGTWPANVSGALAKSTPGQLVGWTLYNRQASGCCVKWYDSNVATSTNSGIGMIKWRVPLPASGGAIAGPGTVGLQFSSGIAVNVTGGDGDSDTTSVLSGQVIVGFAYN